MFEVHSLKGQLPDPNPATFATLADAEAHISDLGDVPTLIYQTSEMPKPRGPKLSADSLVSQIISLETKLFNYKAQYLAFQSKVDPSKFELSTWQKKTQAKWSEYIGSIVNRTDGDM